MARNPGGKIKWLRSSPSNKAMLSSYINSATYRKVVSSRELLGATKTSKPSGVKVETSRESLQEQITALYQKLEKLQAKQIPSLTEVVLQDFSLNYCAEEERLLSFETPENTVAIPSTSQDLGQWVRQVEAHIFLNGGNHYTPCLSHDVVYPDWTTLSDHYPDCGDMNGDGGQNVLDIVNLANCVLVGNCAALPFNACAGDLNGDGFWNILDIVALGNCVLADNCGVGTNCCGPGMDSYACQRPPHSSSDWWSDYNTCPYDSLVKTGQISMPTLSTEGVGICPCGNDHFSGTWNYGGGIQKICEGASAYPCIWDASLYTTVGYPDEAYIQLRPGRSNAQEFAFGLSTNPENSDDPNTMTFRFHFVADNTGDQGVSLYNGTTLLNTTTSYSKDHRYAMSYYQEAGSGIVKWYKGTDDANPTQYEELATATVSPNLTLKADIKMKDDAYLDFSYTISYFLFSPIADDFHSEVLE